MTGFNMIRTLFIVFIVESVAFISKGFILCYGKIIALFLACCFYYKNNNCNNQYRYKYFGSRVIGIEIFFPVFIWRVCQNNSSIEMGIVCLSFMIANSEGLT